jgi:putative endonuclease
MLRARQEFARSGEQAAVGFLRANGYKIIARNYKNKFGEIDIIAREKDTWVFVEVKARRSESFGPPEAAVDKFKQGQISRAALMFLKENKLLEEKARFDVVSLRYTGQLPRINLIKNAFELDGRYSY